MGACMAACWLLGVNALADELASPHQVAPALAFALVNGISVMWLMQFKPAGAP